MSEAEQLVTICDGVHAVSVDHRGRVVSLSSPGLGIELVSEPRLSGSFRLSVPLPGALDHSVEGEEQEVEVETLSDTALSIRLREVVTPQLRVPIAATFTIELDDGVVWFSYEIENPTDHPLAEIWYPILGGVTGLPNRATTSWQAPGYTALLSGLIGEGLEGRLGWEHPLREFIYPPDESGISLGHGIVMPWLTLHDADSGLSATLTEHNRLQRRMSLVATVVPGLHASDAPDNWPTAEELAGRAAGLVLAKVAFPDTRRDRFSSGRFSVRIHSGDWHVGAKHYRRWFEREFPLPAEPSWLRRQDAWFSTILFQPEDRQIATLTEYADWAETAIANGVTTIELLGWDSGGIERDYPNYVPEERLGGWTAYRELAHRIAAAGGNLLTFVNYQVLDSCTEWYARELHRFRRMDSFGNTENWMAWGESTLKASSGADVRRHVPASPAVPGFTELIDPYLVELFRAGTTGLQIDKLCVAGQLDFNPGHQRDPDLPMCEDLVRAIERLLEQCRAVNPEAAFAGEAASDRFIPSIEVFYRAATERDISPLRYVFPEWTACVHTSHPFDRCSVNAAVMLGAVLVVEPLAYTTPIDDDRYAVAFAYIAEALALRRRFLDRIFLADYLDRGDVRISASGPEVDFRVHARHADGALTAVVVNHAREERSYELEGFDCSGASLHAPFAPPDPFAGRATIPAEGLQILICEPRG